MTPQRKYYIIVDGDRHEGPFTFEEVVAHPMFSPTVPVWRDGLTDWAQAQLIVDFADYFASCNPEPQPEPQPQPGPVYEQYQQAAQQPQPQSTPQMPSWWNEKRDTPPPMPSTYLAFAIIMTICCCLPTGIVAIIYSAKVSSAYYAGDYEKSQSCSETSLLWSLASLVLGLLCMPLSMAMQLLTTL